MTEKDDISIAKSVMHTEAQCILDASQRVGTQFQKAIDILDVSRAKVIITGIGKSGHLGKKIPQHYAVQDHQPVIYTPLRLYMEIWEYIRLEIP